MSYKKQIRETASEIHTKLYPFIRQYYSMKSQQEACMVYCCLKAYAEPHNKMFYKDVYDYIKENY